MVEIVAGTRRENNFLFETIPDKMSCSKFLKVTWLLHKRSFTLDEVFSREVLNMLASANCTF